MSEPRTDINGWERELLHQTGLGVDNLLRVAREEGLGAWNDGARIFEFERLVHDSVLNRDSAVLLAAVCLNRLFHATSAPHGFSFASEQARDMLTVISHYLDAMIDQYLGDEAFMGMTFPDQMEQAIADLNDSDADADVRLFTLALCFVRLLQTRTAPEQLS